MNPRFVGLSYYGSRNGTQNTAAAMGNPRNGCHVVIALQNRK